MSTLLIAGANPHLDTGTVTARRAIDFAQLAKNVQVKGAHVAFLGAAKRRTDASCEVGLGHLAAQFASVAAWQQKQTAQLDDPIQLRSLHPCNAWCLRARPGGRLPVHPVAAPVAQRRSDRARLHATLG